MGPSFKIGQCLSAILALLLITAPAHLSALTSSANKQGVVVNGKSGSRAKGAQLIETAVGQESTASPQASESDQVGKPLETIEFSRLEDQTADFVVPALPGWIARPNRYPSQSMKVERQMKAFNQSMRSVNESVRRMNNSIQRIRTPRGY
jgi:hypothetical protein